jgi:hypothetical protein
MLEVFIQSSRSPVTSRDGLAITGDGMSNVWCKPDYRLRLPPDSFYIMLSECRKLVFIIPCRYNISLQHKRSITRVRLPPGSFNMTSSNVYSLPLQYLSSSTCRFNLCVSPRRSGFPRRRGLQGGWALGAEYPERIQIQRVHDPRPSACRSVPAFRY